ncbi:hypothetical protein BGZ94_003485 [Podila epigama]|nr:hypothetical protein BGZ94_003485 [Podila epigama]
MSLSLAQEQQALQQAKARDRIGGRVYTRRNLIESSSDKDIIPTVSHSVPFDIGASWLHGVDPSNPILPPATEGQCEYVHTDDSTMFLEPGKPAESHEYNDHLWSVVWDILDEAQEYAAKHRDTISDQMCLKTWLEDYLSAKQTHNPDGPDYMSPKDRALVPCLAMYWADENAIPLDKVSLKYMDAEKIFPGDHSIVTNGMDRVVKVLAKDLNKARVLLEHVVQRIEYNEFGVKVFTNNGSFSADHVIVAVPLGVLKSNSILFNPPLPAHKQTAIDRLGFGTMFKIVLYFRECFWPTDKHFINFLPTEAAKPNPTLTRHLNARQLHALTTYMRDLANYSSLVPLYNAPILIGYATNESAELMEQLTDEEAMEVYVCQLSHYYEEVIRDPVRYRPVKCLLTRWHSDPFARGSYTSIPIGAHLSDIETFGTPVGARSYTSLDEASQDISTSSTGDENENNVKVDTPTTLSSVSMDDPEGGRIFFAGEHTSPGSFASVHGAIMTGRLAASKILDR